MAVVFLSLCMLVATVCASECDSYCGDRGCGWTTEYSCPWATSKGTNGVAAKGDVGYHCCCEKRLQEEQPCGGDYHGGNDCSYLSNKVSYVNVSDITSEGPIYVGKAPLPEKLHGMFWLVNDGGDALVSLGGPVRGDGSGDCGSGKLAQHGSKYCSSVSTVRGGGWSYQAVTKPGLSSGPFPTIADRLYDSCGMKWNWCFDSDSDPTLFDADPVNLRHCVNLMAMASTKGEYKGRQYGGHYWRVTTLGLGIIPLPSWLLGNFEMIQVMDGSGVKIQPAWDMFAKENDQIVVYSDFGKSPGSVQTTVV
jgi:hypothetical protein